MKLNKIKNAHTNKILETITKEQIMTLKRTNSEAQEQNELKSPTKSLNSGLYQTEE